MASRPQRREPAQTTRLYVVIPRLAQPAELAGALPAILGAADVAAVLLRLPEADDAALLERIRAIAPTVQDRGTALLLEGRPDLVTRCGADGAHLTGYPALKEALPALRPNLIAGAGGLATRDDAMLAGEAGADYVMFGEPDAAGHRPSFPAVVERVAWWTELFEIPCVGYAASLDEVAPLGAARAEFVALGDFIFAAPRGPAAAVSDAAARLAAVEPAG